MDMVERVAAAVKDHIEQFGTDMPGGIARAAIAAMREPTEAMLSAGEDVAVYRICTKVWPRMIDAALKE